MAKGVGQVAAAQNVATYFTLVAALGLPAYGVKKISEFNDKKDLTKSFYELFLINLISTSICSCAYYIFVLNYSVFFSERKLYFVVGLQIVFNIINVDWFYQGREEFKYIMVRSVIVKIISLFAIFVFVKTSNDYIIFALIQTLAKVLNYVFNIFNLKKYIYLMPTSKLNLKQHLNPIFVLLAASIAIEIYTLTDTTMLSAFCSKAVVGYYTNARKGIDIIRTLVTSVCAVFLPRLSFFYVNEKRNEFNDLVNKGLKILLFLSLPAAACVYLLADDLVIVLFGKAFMPAISTIKILSLSIVTVALSNFIGYQVLVTVGKEKVMFYSTLAGAALNIILNYYLIVTMQHNGAAIASVVTELIVTIIQICAVRKIIHLNISIKFIISLAFSIIGMTTSILIIRSVVRYPFLELTLGSLVGIIVFGLLVLITKNEFGIEIRKKIYKIVLAKVK